MAAESRNENLFLEIDFFGHDFVEIGAKVIKRHYHQIFKIHPFIWNLYDLEVIVSQKC